MPHRIRLGTLTELKEKRTVKFSYRELGISREGFVAYYAGEVVCYQNTCRHIPITLDYGDGRFFNEAGTHFVCQTHGATYEPLSGECVAGPCPGAALKKLPLEIIHEEMWVLLPDE